MYVCNCNGLNCQRIQSAIECGAQTPAQVFRHADCKAQCGRCIREMRDKIIAYHGSKAFLPTLEPAATEPAIQIALAAE